MPAAPWFPSGLLLTLRPAAGDRGLHLVVEERGDGARGRVWDARSGALGPELPFAVGFESLLTPDGAWVVDLDDDGGSEVGTLVARAVDGSRVRQLTPGREPFVVRGIETSADGTVLLATIVDDAGHHLLWLPMDAPDDAPVLLSDSEEVWFGHVSADGRLVSADTTAHNPGIRRAAVTVVDVASGEVVAVADDLPAGPVRAVRFSRTPGDPRILLSTERSGFARPAIWDPLTGERRDLDLPDLVADALVLDWHAVSGTVLVVDARPGAHRLLAVDDRTGAARVVADGPGSYAEPDVASVFPYYWQSVLDPDGRAVVVTSGWTTPGQVQREGGSGLEPVLTPRPTPRGRALASALVESADGTPVQLWWATPDGVPRGTVLDVHGGPNLVTLDAFRPDLQVWLEHGFAVASLNYRGSVTFGRAFREGFWGGAGDREVEDVDAAVRWLRARGLADPASTFITGPSYGGHLSLLAAGRLPGHFAGAFALVAMADWEAAWDQMNPALRKTWTSWMSMGPDGVVDPARVPAALAKVSAVNHVASVTASVWLHQGARDTRTPPEQARRYAEALRAAGGDVLVEWFDAGHEPTGTDGVRSEVARMLELAEARLAGRPWASLGPATTGPDPRHDRSQ